MHGNTGNLLPNIITGSQQHFHTETEMYNMLRLPSQSADLMQHLRHKLMNIVLLSTHIPWNDACTT